MERSDGPVATAKLLTPAGGMMLSIVVSGLVWTGLVAGIHVAGLL